MRKKTGRKAGLKIYTMAVVFVWSICSLFSTAAEAQDFPTKPIEVIVPYPAGGSTEISSRLINAEMSKYLGQPMVIVTKAGSGGAIGAEYAAKAKPDGYTVLCSSNSANVISPAINLNIPYTIHDFIPIGQTASGNNILAVHSSSPLKTAQELIKHAKENPGKLTYGTGGMGAGTFLSAELFKKATGIKAEHVPFKGDSPNVTALAGGHVDFSSIGLAGSLSQLEAKRIRALVIFGRKRDPIIPEVPTVSEIGYPGATFASWQAYFVPKGTPKPIIDKLAAALKKAVETPSVKEGLRKLGGSNIEFIGGEELQKRIEMEYKTLRQLAEEGGFLVK